MENKKEPSGSELGEAKSINHKGNKGEITQRNTKEELTQRKAGEAQRATEEEGVRSEV
jgi:hypothetical protein